MFFLIKEQGIYQITLPQKNGKYFDFPIDVKPYFISNPTIASFALCMSLKLHIDFHEKPLQVHLHFLKTERLQLETTCNKKEVVKDSEKNV